MSTSSRIMPLFTGLIAGLAQGALAMAGGAIASSVSGTIGTIAQNTIDYTMATTPEQVKFIAVFLIKTIAASITTITMAALCATACISIVAAVAAVARGIWLALGSIIIIWASLVVTFIGITVLRILGRMTISFAMHALTFIVWALKSFFTLVGDVRTAQAQIRRQVEETAEEL
ncbi:hypothetical protein GGR51DRAFT_463397 [Nemania sp. FL0031]|nr:hypothetical protein GGR51DRAFT_463397 [Nemania sp. FL0031]